ncbi:Uncharacterised protein [Mycobacterium tuberculosis]|nr:Uncharacterised protein [Mycobacterium tuberculosis]
MAGTVRWRLTNRCTVVCSEPLSATQRQGWLLCTDGARHASKTAFLSTCMSTTLTVWSSGLIK